MLQKQVLKLLDENSPTYYAISDKIWDFAELSFEEIHSSQLQADYLKSHGFRITSNAGSVPNAFVAEWGSGAPVVSICGEYDALPGTSQTADLPQQKPLLQGGAGHACGHHLLGTASMAAADVLKTVLEQHGISGTVRYYGCPAEELGGGKAYMVRAGLFDDVDIALSWHPFQNTALGSEAWVACLQLHYVFHGITANPAHSGHLGRSALDAAELMGIGVQYLREHIPPDAKVHYAYRNAGGTAPNVIPSRVEVNYSLRAAHLEDALLIRDRVDRIARGAAEMTDTTVECHLDHAYANFQKNDVVNQVLLDMMKSVPLPTYTEAELSYAQQFRDVTNEDNIHSNGRHLEMLTGLHGQALQAELQKPISDVLLPFPFPMNASTDFGDVSQVAPAGQILVTCFTTGCPCHSWQACAVGKSGIAHKGELYAAKVLALTALEFLTCPDKVTEARKCFDAVRGGSPYISPLPADNTPALH